MHITSHMLPYITNEFKLTLFIIRNKQIIIINCVSLKYRVTEEKIFDFLTLLPIVQSSTTVRLLKGLCEGHKVINK